MLMLKEMALIYISNDILTIESSWSAKYHIGEIKPIPSSQAQ